MSGLYIHLPFCGRKCPYCNFASLEKFDEELIKRYLSALMTDFEVNGKNEYDTMYIGGGTPSAVPPNLLSNFLEKLFKQTQIKGEFTIEANPESLSLDFLHVANSHGVNRLSMGCQSTDNDVLRTLGRLHDRDKIFSSYELARKHLPNADINLDLIFDIPNTPVESDEKSMREIVALEPEHISAYSYSFDTGYLDEYGEAEESAFTKVREFLEDKGYLKYEISNFSKVGHQSKHNINYWKLGDFTGLGMSAWSLTNKPDSRIHLGKTKEMNKYLLDPSSYIETSETKKEDLLKESLVFGLRMTEGIDMESLSSFYNYNDDELEEKIKRLCGEGLIEWQHGKVSLTKKGELLADSVSEFLW
jgi:oxygen-independent coproporphyrinogen-3 oxidase